MFRTILNDRRQHSSDQLTACLGGPTSEAMATTPDRVFLSCAHSDRLLAGALGPTLQRSVLVLTAAAALVCVVVAAIVR